MGPPVAPMAKLARVAKVGRVAKVASGRNLPRAARIGQGVLSLPLLLLSPHARALGR